MIYEMISTTTLLLPWPLRISIWAVAVVHRICKSLSGSTSVALRNQDLLGDLPVLVENLHRNRCTRPYSTFYPFSFKDYHLNLKQNFLPCSFLMWIVVCSLQTTMLTTTYHHACDDNELVPVHLSTYYLRHSWRFHTSTHPFCCVSPLLRSGCNGPNLFNFLP